MKIIVLFLLIIALMTFFVHVEMVKKMKTPTPNSLTLGFAYYYM